MKHYWLRDLRRKWNRKRNKTIPLQGEVTSLFVNTFVITSPSSNDVTIAIIGTKSDTHIH
jgi:hypothetical protein